ncbi:MAG: symmetrical bis(5'-nucleosyl)-tetraphosphatase [Gammaproteobacteria bacterium]
MRVSIRFQWTDEISGLGSQSVVVLGLQELRLLAIAEGVVELRQTDTFSEILATADCGALLKWLYQRPFLHHEEGYTLIHAGIPAEWSLSQARTFAIEAESSLAMGNRKRFFENIAGNSPARWHAKLRGWKRLRFIVNAFTRMSYCDVSGRFDFTIEDSETSPPQDYLPWSQQSDRAMTGHNIICGNVLKAVGENVPGIFPLHRNSENSTSLRALRLAATPEMITVSRS